MKHIAFISGIFLLVGNMGKVEAGVISEIPGPADQGGMVMPMVMIEVTGGTAANPTAGVLQVNFHPMVTPVLRPLTEWSPGDWFDSEDAWSGNLNPVDGSVPGMPSVDAGNGDLFNNQYGFMFMAGGMMGNIPTGYSLGLRLHSTSSPDLKAFNYSAGANRWDQVWAGGEGSQVLWNGVMWHPYFTLAPNAVPGLYSMQFEVFIANATFTTGTGAADYTTGAQNATKNENFTSAYITYQFEVIPEPSMGILLLAGLGILVASNQRRKLSV